ncbi:hypothetical protein [Streptomyces longwoodensis]|uniref:hypothetical protein n=1 Tax=Streptomyces longwoodensis TaxID=68231 RepID=UPI00224D1499|nr:hypothetical protein [Streptomyces longwoodensis]MCX4993818.1 hypothetical protein [Streptomyces longwoodensis]MCX4998062.1 hypothetical protein [Streptomyces longwoodensis]
MRHEPSTAATEATEPGTVKVLGVDGTWQPIGLAASAGIDYSTGPDEQTISEWIRTYGRGASLTATFTAPLTGGLRDLFNRLHAEQRAARDRRIHRLAEDLGMWPDHTLWQFESIEDLLERAGVGDGFGQLTIPQPVQPLPAPTSWRWPSQPQQRRR